MVEQALTNTPQTAGNLPSQVSKEQIVFPVKTYPSYFIMIAVFVAILFGIIVSSFYSGPYIFNRIGTLLSGPSKEIFPPPGIGLDYKSNIYKIPKEVFDVASQVETLSIDYSHLGVIPKDISLFTQLNKLKIKDSGISTIPVEIENLANLTVLDLGGNKLKSIPDFGNLTNLKKLYLYNNQLIEVHESVGNLVGLEVLDLHSNNLRALPPSFGNLSNLKFLYLGNNKLTQQEKDKIKGMLPNTQIFF